MMIPYLVTVIIIAKARSGQITGEIKNPPGKGGHHLAGMTARAWADPLNGK